MNKNICLLKYRKYTLLLLFLFSAAGGYAQQQQQSRNGYNWYFGNSAAMTWNDTQTLVGLSGLPTPVSGSAMKDPQKGVFCMSDDDGQLLFYSDGIKVWNRNHAVMPNGEGLTGDNQSNQSGIVIPYPGQPYKYIAFTIGWRVADNLSYSVIDMTLDRGLGGIVLGQKNIRLEGYKGLLGEAVGAVRHANGTDFWIVAPSRASKKIGNDGLNVWIVTDKGVNKQCFASYPFSEEVIANQGVGDIRFSTDGQKFCWTDRMNRHLVYGTFDPASGKFPNYRLVNMGFRPYGMEFSPSGELLYIGDNDQNDPRKFYVYKFDDLLNSSDPANMSRKTKRVSMDSQYMFCFQMGPDGRMYSPIHGTTKMLVINNPDDYDNFTTHIINGLIPSGSTARMGLPNFLQHYFTRSAITAVNDTVHVTANTPFTVDPMANDILGACLRETIGFDTLAGSGLSRGSLTIEPDRTIIYTPDNDFVGVDSFSYYIKCKKDSCTAKVYISISKPPVIAKNDTLYIGKNSAGRTYTVNVLDNDTGSDLQAPLILSQPNRGTAVNISGNSILFTPDADFDGIDSISYRACDALNTCDEAKVIIIKLPDSFMPVSICAVPPDVTNWSIKEAWSLPTSIWRDALSSPAVGDLDGDGIAEVVAFGDAGNAYNLYKSAIAVLRGTTGDFLAVSSSYTSNNGNNMPTLADLDGDGKGEIIVYNSDQNPVFLTALTFTRTSPTTGDLTVYKTSSTAISEDVANSYNIGVYDFNGDGRPEILVGPYIFNDKLVLIAQNTNITAGTGFTYNTNAISRKAIAADIDNDGKLEIVAGLYTFKVEINDPDDFSKNSITELACSGIIDGFSGVADFDGDGDLDVAVVGIDGVYIWDGATFATIGQPVAHNNTKSLISAPLIADIDGDGKPEIVYNCNGETRCLRYNNGTLSEVWSIKSSNAAGSSCITAFDFNNDGAVELIYRDNSKLRIIDGATTAVKKEYTVHSGTLINGPVVADVNGDGQAEILIMGAETNGGGIAVRCFQSNGDPWRYARPVWNQYMYSGVHINDNLTVPPRQANPAKVIYPNGPDTFRPLNNFLQQHSMLDIETGLPVPSKFLPDLEVLSAKILSETSSLLTVEISVANIGQVVAKANIPVALSANDNTGNYVFVNAQNITSNIPGGAVVTETLIFDITNAPSNDRQLTVNANSNIFPNGNLQTECSYANNTVEVKPRAPFTAVDSNISVFENSEENLLEVSVNGAKLGSAFGAFTLAVTEIPKHGFAKVDDSVILYSTRNYVGPDSLKYSVSRLGEVAEAKMFLNVLKMPDNISDATCYIDPPATPWGIKPEFEYSTVSVAQSPLVGDFDGDGHTDIFVKTDRYNSFTVLKGPDFKTAIKNNTQQTITSAEAVARIKWDDTKDSVIFVMIDNSTNNLLAYNINGVKLWTGTASVFNPDYAPVANARAIGFADFNNDGYAEVYVGNQIFDAVTGWELCNGGADNKGLTLYSNGVNGLFSIAADVIGNSRLELCAGSQVYEVNIVSRTTPSSNSMTVARSVTPTYKMSAIHRDGATVVADFDGDGNLEILVQTQGQEQATDDFGYLYIWKPETEEVTMIEQIRNAKHRNIPFVGDINGDKKPEIVLLTANNPIFKMRAFSVDGATLNELWSLDHTDASGSTGITLFDFNQDGIFEIVYRDEDNLRVINGSLKDHLTGKDTAIAYNLFSTPAYSGTQYEYPVVADVDGDGAAEIITTSSLDPDNKYSNHDAYLRIYKGSPNPWAPARKVWNQYMYNVVNINEDLTVPKYQFNPAKKFPGKENKNDIQPFNNFLQQQTILSKEGTPLWLTPTTATADGSSSLRYYAAGDSLTVTVKVKNSGSADFQAPFKITVYQNTVSSGSLKHTHSYGKVIKPGKTAEIVFSIKNFKQQWVPFNEILIRLNDSGNGENNAPVCESGDRDFSSKPVLAFNDYASTTVNLPVLIDPLLNDLLGTCVRGKDEGFGFADNHEPKHGRAIIQPGYLLLYTPEDGFFGPDSLRYNVTCELNTGTARVYVLTSKPLSENYISCFGKNAWLGFKHIDDVTYHWYTDETGGSPITPVGEADSIEFTKSDLQTETRWVEPHWNGQIFPRIKVEWNLYPQFVPPDIRVHVLPPQGSINLSSYLDTLNYPLSIEWKSVGAAPAIVAGTATNTGTVNLSGLPVPANYTYLYTTITECNSYKAKAYISTQTVNRLKSRDTIYICKDMPLSEYVQLTQITGLELSNGNWHYPNDHTGVTFDNVTVISSGKNAGARVFNAIKAFNEAPADYDWGGYKKFEFEYAEVAGAVVRRVVMLVY